MRFLPVIHYHQRTRRQRGSDWQMMDGVAVRVTSVTFFEKQRPPSALKITQHHWSRHGAVEHTYLTSRRNFVGTGAWQAFVDKETTGLMSSAESDHPRNVQSFLGMYSNMFVSTQAHNA